MQRERHAGNVEMNAITFVLFIYCGKNFLYRQIVSNHIMIRALAKNINVAKSLLCCEFKFLRLQTVLCTAQLTATNKDGG